MKYYDLNGTELKTGMFVKISDAYSKSDNGYYVIQHTPGDPSWLGDYLSLKKVKRNGDFSKGKYATNSYPLHSYSNNMDYRIASKEWNDKNAKIEAVEMPTTFYKNYLTEKVEGYKDIMMRIEWDYGKENDQYKLYEKCLNFYNDLISKMN